MKTRDIRIIIKNAGSEMHGVVSVLERLNEEIQQQSRDTKELAHMFDKLTDNMNAMLLVADNMKQFADKFLIDKKAADSIGKERAHSDLGVSTQSLGED